MALQANLILLEHFVHLASAHVTFSHLHILDSSATDDGRLCL